MNTAAMLSSSPHPQDEHEMPSGLYQIISLWTDKVQDIMAATGGSLYQHSTWIGESLHIQWTKGLPFLHPAYLGWPCAMGRIRAPAAQDMLIEFTVSEKLNDDGLRPLQLNFINNTSRQTIARLGFFLQDKDEQGRLLILPMWEQTHAFMKKGGLLWELATASVMTIMEVVLQVQYD